MAGPGAEVAGVEVVVRVRPPLRREVGEGGRFTSCLGLGPPTAKGQTIFVSGDDSPVLLKGEGAAEGSVFRYTFDKVVPRQTMQEEMFNLTMQGTLEKVFTGSNGTVLAYGQTGSGKTYTMLGGQGEQEGLVPRTISALLANPQQPRVAVSMVQIYQEVVTDLLNPTPVGLSIRGGVAGVVVEGLTERRVACTKDARMVLEEALSRRVVGETKLNEVSSRSHLIIRLVVRVGDKVARLNMVDLAGSERLKDSQAEGVARKETMAINSSLFALIAVVQSLSSGQSFIPYRNSKLTLLLSDSLGGQAFTTVLVTVSPSQQFVGETKSSLKFAHSCKRIEHLVVENRVQLIRKRETKPEPPVGMPWADLEVSFQKEMITTGLCEVACYTAGPEAGPPLLLLHGCPSSTMEFLHLLPGLVHAGYRVVGLDQPGHGSSPGPRASSRSDRAGDPGGPVDVLKAAMDHLGLERPVLLGYDWGAGIALTFSILHPSRVSKVISFLPSFSETPETRLEKLSVPTMVMWVKQDQNHSWKRFQGLAKKIPGVRVEFVKTPDPKVNYVGSCYAKLSDEMMAPMVHFLTGRVVGGVVARAARGRELPSKSTKGHQVVEVCNVNFEEEMAPEEIEDIMKSENPESNAVKLFEHYALRHGYEALYKAEEDHSHELHRSVCAIFRALPTLSPQHLADCPSLLVDAGLWTSLPAGWEAMKTSPRYFPGRLVLVKVDTGELKGGVVKVCRIVRVGKEKVVVDHVSGKEFKLSFNHEEIGILNQPHEFFFEESTGKLRLEDGLHCDYKSRLVRAKMAEICLSLAPLVESLDFNSPKCEELQKEAIRQVRSCLNMVTFQGGVDRARVARSDSAGRLAVNGQGHCHGVSSVMTAFLLPLAPVLGIDLKYRGCFTFDDLASGPVASETERHQCLEVTLRPSGTSLVVDLWMEEKYTDPGWLLRDIQTAYSQFMYPNGALIIHTKPVQLANTDFSSRD